MRRLLSICLFSCLVVSLLPGQGHAAVSVSSAMTDELTVQPGQRIERQLQLQSSSKTKPEEAILYKVDYSFRADGTTDYPEPGTLERSNANWITIQAKQITVPPSTAVKVPYIIDVPKDVSLNGAYWSIIFVEPVLNYDEQMQKKKDARINVGVLTKVRYGLQVVTTIKGSGVQKMEFTEKRVDADEAGNRAFVTAMKNTGTKLFRPKVWAEFYTKDGKLALKAESSAKRIYPGCSVSHYLDITKLEKGKQYKTIVIADDGEENVFGAEYTLDF
jgi:hypothetical protein